MSIEKKRQGLIAEISAKFEDGMVLDASRMWVERITYTSGECDDINGFYKPCLCTNAAGEIAVDYFEKCDPIPLAEQIGLQCSYGWPLNNIVLESLDAINQSMVKP